MKWQLPVLLLAATTVASAGVLVVYPGQSWTFMNDKGAGGSAQFTFGPAAPPAGEGSAEIAVTGNNAEALATAGYGGTRFDSITELTYSTFRSSGGPMLAMSLQFDVDINLVDGVNSYQGRLVYEPYLSGQTILDNTWQTWDALQGANWWFSRNQGVCPQNAPCTWAQILGYFPNAGVLSGGGTMFKAGSAWTDFDGNVDNFTVGINGSDTTYDFEPAPEPATWGLLGIGMGLMTLAGRYRR